MQRRQFLSWAAAGAVAPMLAGRAWAEAVDHSVHGMPTAGAGMPAVAELRLPTGLPLPALPRIAAQREGRLLRARLEAAPLTVQLAQGLGKTQFWAYNGSVPGPLIEAEEGDTVEIAFRNRLAQPTTVHWHGMPVPAEQDGNPHDAVAPGEERVYRFTLPQGSAATYWYHPHPHGVTGQQVYMGLAGAFIVRRRDDPLASLPEQHLILSDLKLDADGRIAANSAADRMDGREGQFVLVNGAWQPQLALGRGERQRWRVWNATSARVLRLALPAHELLWVGSDGGLIERALPRDEIVLAPGQRAELVVTGRFRPGKASALQALPYRRGKMMGPEQQEALSLLSVVEGKAAATAPLPQRLASIAPLPEAAVRRRVVLSEDMSNLDAMFLINGRKYDMDRMDFTGKVGVVEEWEVVNEADMDHPFHLHGTQFQVVAQHDGKAWRDEGVLAWRDVVNVLPGQSVRLRFRQDLPGVRMYHCHILEHEDQGMMGQLLVKP